MPSLSGGPAPEVGPPSSSSAAAVTAAADSAGPLARAAGVELIGQTKGSGYREPPSLVRRSDGQAIQLTTLLYQVLEAVDGHRSVEEIAARASAASGRLISAGNVRNLVDSQLRPLGLLRLADGSEPEVKKANPLLGMRFRFTVTDPERTRMITSPFARLFHPIIIIAVTLAFVAAAWWVLAVKGLGSATHEAFANPALLLLVLTVTILSAGFHEFGHAAAARRGGATPGSMGAGLYLIWPAFYTDVTDSYRLDRAGRIRTDLGGLYFNAIVAVAVTGVWWATGYDALLLVVVTQLLQMVRQLLPLVRFDGYHLLADITGVPDMFQRIKPTLRGLLPWHWGEPENRVLKPWARAVVSVWVLVTVPLLLFCLALMIISMPRLLGTAWASIKNQHAMLLSSFSAGDATDATVRVLAILIVALPVLGIGVILMRLVAQLAAGLYRKTRGRPARRATAFLATAAVLAGLAWAWWPDPHTYRPVQAYERGTLMDAVSAVSAASATDLAEGRQGRTTTILPEGTSVGTPDKPQLAMLLVARQDSRTEGGTTSGTTDSTATPKTAPSPAWVFPFDRPLPPDQDGNQALAVNTTDGTITYDVAFALVWAEGEPVDSTNEAYAFASCTGCAAVAVGFQVVLILGQANIVVPENLAAAVNYNCAECLTYALASQLVLTLDGPLSDGGMAKLAVLWADIAEFGHTLHNIPLSEIQDRLNAYKQQIMDLIAQDPATATTGPAATAPPTSGSTASPAAPTPGTTAPSTSAPGGAIPDATLPPQPGTAPTPVEPTTTAPTVPPATPAPASSPSGTPAPEASVTPAAAAAD